MFFLDKCSSALIRGKAFMQKSKDVTADRLNPRVVQISASYLLIFFLDNFL